MSDINTYALDDYYRQPIRLVYVSPFEFKPMYYDNINRLGLMA